MAALEEKPSMVEADSNSSQFSTPHDHDRNTVSDTDGADAEKPIQAMTEDQYPHGIKLVLLAGASIIAVFLIALDQVSTHEQPTLLAALTEQPI